MQRSVLPVRCSVLLKQDAAAYEVCLLVMKKLIMAFIVTPSTGLLRERPYLFACSEVLLAVFFLFRHCDTNQHCQALRYRMSEAEFIILSGCNYLLALGSERFLCVPRTHILKRE